MITAALALFGAFGAWLAWRRNPMYSASSSLRILGVVAVSIAVLVLAIVAAVKFTENRSGLVLVVTMFTVVVLGTFAMIFVIQTVSTPKEARLATVLPASAKLVQVHRGKVYHWAKILGILIAVFAVLGAVVPGNPKFIALSFGGITLLLAVILLPVAYINALHFDRSLTATELDPWVHWQYSPAQWNEWVETQVARMKTKPPTFILKRDWRKFALPFAIIAGGVIFFSPGPLVFRIGYVLVACGAIFGLTVYGTGQERRQPERMRAQLGKAAPEVYFGHDGLFCDGVYTTWLSLNVYLMSASIDERPPRSLSFNFEQVTPSPYTGNQISAIQKSVVLPPGAESDVTKLQRELSARCPKARVQLAAIAR